MIWFKTVVQNVNGNGFIMVSDNDQGDVTLYLSRRLEVAQLAQQLPNFQTRWASEEIIYTFDFLSFGCQTTRLKNLY